jgi:hypothetical protein
MREGVHIDRKDPHRVVGVKKVNFLYALDTASVIGIVPPLIP